MIETVNIFDKAILVDEQGQTPDSSKPLDHWTHNPLVEGSSPSGPTNIINQLQAPVTVCLGDNMILKQCPSRFRLEVRNYGDW